MPKRSYETEFDLIVSGVEINVRTYPEDTSTLLRVTVAHPNDFAGAKRPQMFASLDTTREPET
jgi:hypothetical protein